ncbi:Ig-like domain-containing protein [Flavobacterium sp. Fl-318]|uniref:Ig-like domain-containing protein n=1 Tax=Flavobacterium cupriresistens TaxID=2893885 RepID=A0ABU4RJK6_9FLAO|nr:Ig-like domain-containing protein [Flavobacterium sp. Fl-318]MDX6191680.1 Ig-like domain-containing protein [Flavobacterium sp. Fl-318]
MSSTGYAQVQTTHTAGPNDATILSTLDGSGVVLSSPTLVKGDRAKQIAIFSGGIPAGLGISNGLLFSTGFANTDLGTKNTVLHVDNVPSGGSTIDSDLNSLNSTANYDAVVYTFKVTLDAKMTAIRIFFQFGSEEYPNFVGSKYNDVFGFFISGPGVVGTQNIARLPSSNREISVNSVNGGNLGFNKDSAGTPTTDLTQTAFYINNGHSIGGVENNGVGARSAFVEYNGLTKMMSYDLTGLTPGATYNFKIAIADVGDASYDSGVFVDVITASYGADLSVKKELVGVAKKVGDVATFAITANNAGPYGATGVKVNDLLPSGYTFVSAVPSVGTYDAVTGVWNIGSLANRANATLTVKGILKTTGDYNNVARITGIEDDPDPLNNEGSKNPVKGPVAVNDSKTTNEDTVVTIDVTTNDTDVDGSIDVATVDLDPATAGKQTTFTVTGQGTYTVDALGVVTFTPIANFNGTATPVNYTVNDNDGFTSNTGQIDISITAVNDAPVAVNDSKTTNEDTAITIDVTTNDTDVDGTIDIATVDLDLSVRGIQTTFTVTGEGTYSVDVLGVVTFTPVANYNGTATPVNYTVNDNSGLSSNIGTINITVTSVNDAPVAVNDSKTTNEDTVVTIDITTNDTDIDGTIDVTTVDLDPATTGKQTTFTVTGEGTYSVDALGVVTFTPVANYNGTATPVNYTVNDNSGTVSNTGTINITVTSVNDAPVAANDSKATNEDIAVTIDVTTNDTDVDGTIDVATVDLDPATTGKQTTFTVTGEGTYSVDTSGVVTFTPAANYNGTATPVNYTVNDNSGTVSNTGTINITVTSVNDAPVAANDSKTTNEDTVVTIDVSTNDTDIDGTIDVATVDLDPATAGKQTTFTVTGEGTYSVDTFGVVNFTPVSNFNGTATPVNYTVNDNSGLSSNTGTINITVIAVNDAPVAMDDSKTTNEDTVVTIDITTNDTDVDGSIDVATVDLDPATVGKQTTFTVIGEGTYSVDAFGVVTFTPVANYNGSATPVNYTVNDNSGTVSNTGTINITITSVNDAPLAVNDSKTINEDTTVTIDVTTNDTDVDGSIDVATVDFDPATAGKQTTFTVTGEGTYSVDAFGVVTFTPVANYNGTATPVNYTVNDNSGLSSNIGTINITVTAVNDAPVAVNDSKTTNEDTAVTIDVTTNDTDVDGTIDVATVDLDPVIAGIQTTFTVTGEGTYSVDAFGVVTFTPVLNFSGTATAVNYTVNDNSATVSNVAQINITVTSVNDAPVAVNDSKTTDEDIAVTIDVTTNDTDIDGSIDVATVDLDPATAGKQTTFTVIGEGTYRVDAFGVVTFTPVANYNGTATSVNYTVNDNSGLSSNIGTINITVTSVNDAPVAVNDSKTTNEDTVITVDVTTNDTDVDGSIDVATVDLDPATAGKQTTFTVIGEGTYSVDAFGVVTFTPVANYNGTTTAVNYTVNDNSGLSSNIGTINITVTAVNDAPVAVNDFKTTDEDIAVTIHVTTNDTDIDGTIDVASVDLDPAIAGKQTTFTVTGEGTYSVDAFGVVTFTPVLNFSGTATAVNYTVNDNSATVSNVAQINITVTSVNDAPVAVNDSKTTDEDIAVTIDVTTNDTDIDGSIDVATVDLDPATAGKQTTFTVIGEGTYRVDAFGVVTFTPVANYNGTATSVNYTVNDNSGLSSNIGTINITVTSVNDAPVAVNDSKTTNEDTVITVDVTTNDTDVDGSIDVATVDLDPATAGKQTTFTVIGEGTYSVDAFGVVTFTPVANYNGTTTAVNYTVNDNSGLSSNIGTINITVTAVNDAPVAVNDFKTTDEDIAVTIHVTTNDTDIDGTIDVASVDLDPAIAGKQTTFTVTGEGTYSVDTFGVVTFTPVLNFNGIATAVNYTVNDNDGFTSNTGQIDISITAVNDAPVAVNDSKTTNEDTVVTIDVTTNDSDLDGTIDVATVDLDPATVGKQTTFTVIGEGTYSVDAFGVVTFTPVLNFNGTATAVNYTVNDNSGTVSNVAQINITVTSVNDAPVAVNDSKTTNEDTVVTIDVTTNDTDIDGTIDVATVDLDPATAGKQTTFIVTGEGTYNVDALGVVTFTPAANYNGTATPVNYTVNDNSGTVSNVAQINITVTSINDAPVAVNDSKTTNEDTTVTIDITINDTDVDGSIDVATVDLDPATAGKQTTFTVTGEGMYSVDALGIVTFTPVANYNGTATPVNYTVNDNSGTVSNTGTINITVTAVNDAPVAVNDSKTTNEDTTVTIDVTTNDTDVDGSIDVTTVDLDPATAGKQTTFIVTGEGTYSVDALGVVTFTPVANYNGSATPVNYTVNDNSGTVSNTGTINITITSVNDAPLAVNDSKTTNEDTVVTIDVTTNDTDVDGSIDVATVDLDPATAGKQTTFTITGEGTYSVDALGVVTFTPVANYNGTATPVNYTVNDNSGTVSNVAQITITVIAVNDAPVAVNDSKTTNEDTVVTIDVSTNDTDVDGTIDVASVDLDPATAGKQTTFTVTGEGTYIVDALGVVTFTPVANYNGTATPVNYTVNDNSGTVSNVAQINISVTAVNNTPVAFDDNTNSVIPSIAGATTIKALTGKDDDGTIISYTILSLPLNGTLALSGKSVTVNQVLTPAEAVLLTYDPSGAFYGDDTFTFTVTDDNGAIDQSAATITLIVAKNQITANPDSVGPIVGINQKVTVVNVLTNDTFNGGPVVVGNNPGEVKLTPVGPVPPGLTLHPDGTVTIAPNTPAGDYNLTYQICESISQVNCSSATVTIKVVAPAMTIRASSYCSNNMPYVTYNVSADNFTPTDLLTINWVDSAGNVVAVQNNLPLSGNVLWPGAIVDSNGKGVDWPGWVYTNGQWAEGNDGFELTKPAVTMVFSLNHTQSVDVNYPTEISGCKAKPGLVIVANDDLNLTADGINGSLQVVNVLHNDKFNGITINPSQVILKGLTVPTGITLNDDGTVDVSPNIAGGYYTLIYQICEDGNSSNCVTAKATIFVEVPAIAIIKTAVFNDENGNGYANAGETITYYFKITNTGNTALTNVTVSDPLPNILMTGTPISLQPDEVNDTAYKGSYVITQSDINSKRISNQATVSGTSPIGVSVDDKSDDSTNAGDKATILEIEGCVIEIFNAVSANGDSKNERFYIQGLECYPDNRVEIYNRWGVLVFERDQYNNEERAFRGISEGRVTVKESGGLPTGTYYYILKYKDNDSNAHQKAGYLYLNK